MITRLDEEHSVYRLLAITTLLLVLLLVPTGSSAGAPATFLSPIRIGGALGHGNERDIDYYPAVAFDAATDRYLAVWMTVRNATSSSAHFDVYGVFLDKAGKPSTEEFRISDTNGAALNSAPAAAAGNGEFVVAWTVVGSPCRIHYQRVTDASSVPDRQLTSGATHQHSPSLAYDAVRGRYLLAFVEGDDYLPPTLFGASTADCGNNDSSTSCIKAMEFHFDDGDLVAGAANDVCDVHGGAFRPRLAYSGTMDQYLIAWEDRRNAAGQPYLFDVYAQRLRGDIVLLGDNIHLAGPIEYENYDTSATWTPRPVVAGGDSRFLVAWFTREEESAAVVWGVRGALVSAGGNVATPFDLAEILFAASHVGESPTGFLSAVHVGRLQEYMIGLSSHLESLWGYFSFVLVQRVSANGTLLAIDGSPQLGVRIGTSIDYENDNQIFPAIAVGPENGVGHIDLLVTYAKHASNTAPKDLDIWAARIQVPIEIAPTPTGIIPMATLTPTPTGIVPTATLTPTPPYAPPATDTPTPPPLKAWPLPLILKCAGLHYEDLIVNGGFETGEAWEVPITCYSAGHTETAAHTGRRSMRLGISNPVHNIRSYSPARQRVTISQNAARAVLGFWIYPMSGESGPVPTPLPRPQGRPWLMGYLPYDVQYLLILDQTERWIDTLIWQCTDDRQWMYCEFDLAQYAGQTIKLHFGAYNNGQNGVTGMYLDDVSLRVRRSSSCLTPVPYPAPG